MFAFFKKFYMLVLFLQIAFLGSQELATSLSGRTVVSSS